MATGLWISPIRLECSRLYGKVYSFMSEGCLLPERVRVGSTDLRFVSVERISS